MPLDTDDLAPPPKKPERPDLHIMSVEDLERRIFELRAEIETIEGLIASKRSARSAADAVFNR